MQYRRLGKTNLQISAIGLGGWALGGGVDWGNTDPHAVMQTVSAALEAGINWIDTAPIYAASELLLGQALQGRRHRFFVSTKCGLVKNGSWTDHDLRASTIITQLETSLRLLRSDYIDIYFIHYLDPRVPWEAALDTLAALQQQGKIRYIGVCNVPAAILTQMLDTGLVSCVQDELSLLHPHKSKEVLKICTANDLGFMAYGPLCGGILSAKYKREPNFRRADARNYFYKCYRGESFTQAQGVIEKIQTVAQHQQISPVQVALGWVLAQQGVSGALTGARSAAQVMQNAASAEIALSKEDLCTLQK